MPPTLLLVDDDDDLRDTVEEFLTSEGYDVRCARDGEEGLKLLCTGAPDAVLLDVEMPKLDGPGMALEMFLHDVGLEEIPIVLFSGTADLSAVASEVGTRYVVPKPTSPELLKRTLDLALRERAPPRPSSERRRT